MKKLAILYANEKVTFWVLAFMLSALVGVYIYSLNTAVMNVVKRGAMEKQISAFNSAIADLESNYISLKKNINLDMAYSLGYKEVEKTTYIPRKSVSIARDFRIAE